MKNNLFIYILLLLLFSCGEQGKKSKTTKVQVTKTPTTRTVENNIITSTSLPEITIQVSEEFKYVGNFDFEIIANSEEYEPEILGKPIASGERMVFVGATADSMANKLFIVQFEGFLPQYDFTYNYDFSNAEYIGDNRYRHNTWFYNSKQLADENPEGEGAKTRKFLKDKGYHLEDEFMMSRFVGLASSDRKHEIIIYYIEMLRKNTGHTLEEFESLVDEEEAKKIRNELIGRSRYSFTIIKG